MAHSRPPYTVYTYTFTCPACGTQSPAIQEQNVRTWGQQLRAVGWGPLTVDQEQRWICAECALTPQESAVMVALRCRGAASRNRGGAP